MTPVSPFEDCLRLGTVKKKRPEISRAKFLIKESVQNYSFLLELLEKFEITNNNANNFVKSCYDIIMELLRAKLLVDGYAASGLGAHEAEVSYMRKLGFSESEIRFADQLKYFRNGMLYYGTSLDKEYAGKVVDFTKKNYFRLLKILEGYRN